MEARNKQEFGWLRSIRFDSKAFFLEGFLILLPEEAFYIVDAHIVKWNNNYDSQNPNDIPQDSDSLKITHSSSRDDSKLHKIVIALLKCSQEQAQG